MTVGNLFVISGPSGVGKGTLLNVVMKKVANCWFSVSATTRKPREGEIDGVHYFFLSKEEFESLIEHDGLLEWAQYVDNCYGTPRKSVIEKIEAGFQVFLDIEYQGAFQVKEKMPEAHLVFIEPPSMEVLKERLTKRGTETPETIADRLETAEVELSHKTQYDFCIVNDDLETAANELISYINSFR